MLTVLTLALALVAVEGSRRSVAVFHSKNLRLHDNPVLLRGSLPVVPVFVDEKLEGHHAEEAVHGLREALQAKGGELLLGLSSFLSSSPAGSVGQVVYSSHSSALDASIESTCRAAGVVPVRVHDSLLSEEDEAALQSSLQKANELSDLNFEVLGKPYAQFSLPRRVPLPEMEREVTFAPPLAAAAATAAAPSPSSTLRGEAKALALLRDYVALGDAAFSLKYQHEYFTAFPRSPELRRSLARLAASDEAKGSLNKGEVVSALLSPLIAQGCVSPRLLVHAQRSLQASSSSSDAAAAAAPNLPVWLDGLRDCQLRQEAVRKHWHARLVEPTLRLQKKGGSWDAGFSSWRGYIYRHGVMRPSPAAVAALAASGGKQRAFVLLHGFGGSIDQYTGLARELSQRGHVVFGLDSQGFGNSEKPPLSYNQYSWRDHALEFIQDHVEGEGLPLILCGNSIGGFCAASSAAVLGKERCAGVVLFNSAGRLLEEDANPEGSGYEKLAEPKDCDFLFPPYQGPAPALLSVFGKVIFALLQPNIRRTTEWLYPVNPQHVAASRLPENILRDSSDPGASEVIAAGGKLPPPRSMDGLFADFGGPVLIAQGAKDPLNDAPGRAAMFGRIASGGAVSVDLLDLGHCAMDEGAGLAAAAIDRWLGRSGVL